MSRDIKLLHPKLQAIIAQLEKQWRAAGLNVLITQTYRTKAEQDALYSQGRTKPGKIVTNAPYPYSAHNWGVAFDFCRNDPERAYDDSDGFFRRAADIAKPHGLNWGGDWKSFVDKPHLEMTEFSSIATLIKLYRDPAAFIKTWNFLVKEDDKVTVYRTLNDLPKELDYAKPTLLQLMTDGIIAGDGNKDLPNRVINLTEDMIRELLFSKRMIDAAKAEITYTCEMTNEGIKRMLTEIMQDISRRIEAVQQDILTCWKTIESIKK